MTKPMRNIPTASELQEPEKERQLKRLPMRNQRKSISTGLPRPGLACSEYSRGVYPIAGLEHWTGLLD